MNVTIKSVFGVDALFHFLILIREVFGIFNHLFYLLLGKAAFVVGNCYLLTFSSALVLSANVQNTVRINFEGNLNLRLSARRRRDSTEFKLPQ